MGPDSKSTAKAILGMGPPSAEDGDLAMPPGELDVDSEDAALEAAADEAFAAVQANDAVAFRAAFKAAIEAIR